MLDNFSYEFGLDLDDKGLISGIDDMMSSSNESELNSEDLIDFIKNETETEPAYGLYLEKVRQDRLFSFKEKKRNKRIRKIDIVLR